MGFYLDFLLEKTRNITFFQFQLLEVSGFLRNFACPFYSSLIKHNHSYVKTSNSLRSK